MFDSIILDQLMYTIPFIVGYQRPIASSQRARQAAKKAYYNRDYYNENKKNLDEWTRFQDEVQDENDKTTFWSYGAALVSAAIGFAFGGPAGMITGWNAGKGVGRQLRKQAPGYFDPVDELKDNKILSTNKFNATSKNAKLKEAINEFEDMDDAGDLQDLLSIGSGIYTGVTTDWSTMGLGKGMTPELWRDQKFKQKVKSITTYLQKNRFGDFLSGADNEKIIDNLSQSGLSSSIGINSPDFIDSTLVNLPSLNPSVILNSNSNALKESVINKRVDSIVDEVIADDSFVSTVMDNDVNIFKDVAKNSVNQSDLTSKPKNNRIRPFKTLVSNINEQFNLDDWFNRKVVTDARKYVANNQSGVMTPEMKLYTSTFTDPEMNWGIDPIEIATKDSSGQLKIDWTKFTDFFKGAPLESYTKSTPPLMNIPDYTPESNFSNILLPEEMNATVSNATSRGGQWKPFNKQWRQENDKFMYGDSISSALDSLKNLSSGRPSFQPLGNAPETVYSNVGRGVEAAKDNIDNAIVEAPASIKKEFKDWLGKGDTFTREGFVETDFEIPTISGLINFPIDKMPQDAAKGNRLAKAINAFKKTGSKTLPAGVHEDTWEFLMTIMFDKRYDNMREQYLIGDDNA